MCHVEIIGQGYEGYGKGDHFYKFEPRIQPIRGGKYGQKRNKEVKGV